jgi:hypothetical protein
MAGDVRHGPQGSHDSGTVDKCPFCDCVALRQGLLAVSNPRVAFYDAQPLNPGHVLIVPYRHEPDFLALLPDDRNSIGRTDSTSTQTSIRPAAKRSATRTSMSSPGTGGTLATQEAVSAA